MAIKQDGTQAYGISTASFSGFIVESFTRTSTGNRVDLDDGDGAPLGSVTVAGRVEGSLTVQVGAGNTTPTIGAEVTYGSDTFIVTEVGEAETQADYQRLNLSVYKKLN